LGSDIRIGHSSEKRRESWILMTGLKQGCAFEEMGEDGDLPTVKGERKGC
jgi:hypothetical protein